MSLREVAAHAAVPLAAVALMCTGAAVAGGPEFASGRSPAGPGSPYGQSATPASPEPRAVSISGLPARATVAGYALRRIEVAPDEVATLDGVCEWAEPDRGRTRAAAGYSTRDRSDSPYELDLAIAAFPAVSAAKRYLASVERQVSCGSYPSEYVDEVRSLTVVSGRTSNPAANSLGFLLSNTITFKRSLYRLQRVGKLVLILGLSRVDGARVAFTKVELRDADAVLAATRAKLEQPPKPATTPRPTSAPRRKAAT
ncbi:MAG: hypothetical protein ACT4PP_01505 [Sporichthyaceae bacterium]